MGPAALGQTIAIVDRSGKVISTSRTLLGVFKEAKAAYRERKAEIVAERRAHLEAKQARRTLEQLSLDDRSVTSKHTRQSGSRYQAEHAGRQTTERPDGRSLGGYEERSIAASRPGRPSRRHTAQTEHTLSRRRLPTRSVSYPEPDIDMDLAYGELPPPDPITDEAELKGLMSRASMLLDEAHCVQHSVTATIASLQKDPDALAAVALTLAEISNLAAKMAPGALTAMKGSFPAVFALLASPQFMIAAGVGLGVVVVALGGYKIIKKIKARNIEAIEEEEEEEEKMDELLEIGPEFDRIEMWRRGVAITESGSVGTSVDAEFITPEAAAIRQAAAVIQEDHRQPSRKEVARKKKTKKSHGSSMKGEKTEEEKRAKKRHHHHKAPLKLLFRS